MRLEIPAIHFMCDHSYNLKTAKVQNIRENLRAGAHQQERFFQEVRAAPDGFAKVAEYFGRGMMTSEWENEEQLALAQEVALGMEAM